MKKKRKKVDLTEIAQKGARIIRNKNDKYTSTTQKGVVDSRFMKRCKKIQFSVRKNVNGADVIVIYGIDRRTFKRFIIGYVEPPIKGKY